MARRGDELRDHILRTAKDVFIEMGFERTSMDVVATRAATSKRSLYAHFESKDKLASAQYYDAIFATTSRRLAAFLTERCGLTPATSTGIARELLGRTVYPPLFGALLGIEEPLYEAPDEASIAAGFDLEPIRRAVATLLPSAVRGDG